MRGRLASAVAALLIALCLPVSTLAGGWVVVTLDSLPPAPPVGDEIILGFMARHHGRAPLSDARPRLEFTHRDSGERVTAFATEEGAGGHYTARVVFPRAGAWDWRIELWHTHSMPAIEVMPAATVTAPSPAAQPAPSTWRPLLGAGALMLLALTCLTVSWRLRGRQAMPRARAQTG